MIKTSILLIIAIIVVPVITLFLDPHPLSDLQLHMLKVSGLIALGIGLLCYTVAELTNNCSQVDKLWSINPIIYAWYFAWATDWNARLVLMAVCVTIWGVRLTYNFGRKGAYKLKFWTGEEDYRWEIIRANPTFNGHPMRFRLFNLFFISLYQNGLIWLFTLPALMAYSATNPELKIADYLLAGLYIGLVIIEGIADQQQWKYQEEKKRKKLAGIQDSNDPGFINTGLWGIVRHPNYACEQAIWITFYFFSVVPDGHWINWSLTGCVLLMVLFQASSDFSEGISSGKYTKYKDYISKVPRFIPGLG